MGKPKIRFKGYTEDWEQRKFGDVGSVSMCKRIFKNETSDNGEIPFYKIGTFGGEPDAYISRELFEEYKGKFSYPNKGDILLSASGTIGRIVEYDGEEAYFQDSNIVWLSHDKSVCNKFLKVLYPIVRWDGIEGSTIQRLYNDNFLKTRFMMPGVEEQEKIGEYFSRLDNLITLHQRKCNETKKLKKYMLQKMFPQNGLNFPEIRFKGYTDAWEQRKLGELCERVTRKNKNGESDLPLTIASQYGLIDQRDFFNKVVAAKDMSNYYLLKKGEFAYNKSYSNGFDYGSIKRLNAYEQGCLSTLYICFGITSDDIESDYLECFFDTLKWYSDITMICAEGARNHGLLNVDTKAFFDEVTIEMPTSKEEQKQISTYLNNLDHLITLHQKKCDELKKMKKFMLQNMFV